MKAKPQATGQPKGEKARDVDNLSRRRENSSPPGQMDASALLFREILQSVSDGVLAVNRDNQVVFANERFAELWRIPQEAMSTKDDSLLFPFVLNQLPDPQEFLQKMREPHHAAEESFDTLHLKDGRVFERTSRPLLVEGEAIGRVMTFRDVTAHTKMEQALAASEAELRALFASMYDVVIVIDRDGVYRKIAPTNPSLLYKSPQELLGKNLTDVFPPQESALFRQVIRQVLETKQSARIEYVLDIGGRSVWFQTTVSRLDEDSTLWVAHDITNRKEMEAALRTAEERYRSIFENAVEGIFQSLPAGRFLSVNAALARMLGYETPEEVLENITDIASQLYVNPERRAELKRALAEDGFVTGFESQIKRKDGKTVWVRENSRAVRDANGEILYYEGFVTDITERRQADEALRYARDALESANMELQQALEREKLLACTDGLTGLYNRRHFFELAEREFRAALRHQRPLTFLMFDMDGFKQVNDTLGHAAGDQLLEMVAQTAVQEVRASDAVARYGGDEFVLMLPQTTARQALPVAERIRTRVAALRLETNQAPLGVTLSIGIAEISHHPPDENADRVIQRADEALYRAKNGGRNRTVIFERKDSKTE